MDSDSDHDDFVSYGTPLEVIEEDEPLPKPIAVKDQVVRDRQGRQRFHGAFTGGFSAGFFNTVGSKEGFTPLTFVSTREKRAEKQAQRAEDFMDVDDMGEFGIAPRKVVTTAKFAGDESGARKRPGPSPGSTIIPDDGRIQDLIKPADDTIGMKLLRKMGWKPGQGIGPKIERRKKRKKKGKGKVYGCARPPVTGEEEDDDSGNKAGDSDGPSGSEDDEDEDEDEEDFMRGFLFAPDDIQDFIFALKDDVHGIGYHGMDSSKSVLGGHVTLFDEPVTSRNRRQGIKGHAFGIGAFEEEDDEIYSSDRLSNYDRVLGGEEEASRQLYGWTGPPTHHTGSDDVLDGFKAASKKKLTPKVFHPPALPRDFRPFHQFRSTAPAVPGPAMGAQSGSSRFTLSAEQRAAMLGEERLPGYSPVDKALPSEDLARIRAFRDQSAPPAKVSPKPEEKRGSRWDRGAPQAPVESAPRAPIASAGGWSGSSFKPFEKNPEKQQRYEAFLKYQQRGSVPGDSRTEWERQQEQEEFARAAALYRPMSGMMASRFVSAKHSDADDTVEVQAETGGDENDQSKAAEMKMFGQLTRDSLEWHPDKLLCKRFNVADPYPGSTTVGLLTVKKDKFSVFNFLEVQQPSSLEIQTFPSLQVTGKEKSQDGLQGPGSLSSSHQKKSRWDQHPGILAAIGTRDKEEGEKEDKDAVENATKIGPSETDQNTTTMATEDEDKPRPPMDLFQAIFLDSDTESDDEDDDEDGSEKMRRNLVKSDAKPAEEAIRHDDVNIPKSSRIGDQGSRDTPTASSTVDGTQQGIISSLSPSGAAPSADNNSADVSTSAGSSDRENHASDRQEEDIYGPRLPPTLDQDQRGPVSSTATPSARLATSDRGRPEEVESDGRREREGRRKDRREGKKKRKKKEKKAERHRSREQERGRHKKESGSKRDSTSGKKKHHKGKKTKHRHHKRHKPSHHRPTDLGKREAASSSDYDASQSSDSGR
ncbi:G patch domain-containing protein 1-like [Diadema antillarum]|uniref:G patch domain-containing protein 1-like n=1 Tax=Diadema antillarum TaxID=105358 RepID=UPI003A896B70